MKLKGLLQVDDAYIVTDLLSKNNPTKIKAVWKSVKDLDIDSSGFVPLEELA